VLYFVWRGVCLQQKGRKEVFPWPAIIKCNRVIAIPEKAMRLVKVLILPAIVVGGLLVCTSSIHGTQAYAKKEKKSCTFCHAKVASDKAEMNKNLKTVGTCYKDNDHSLAKCAPSK
jgi:hypothetical protein